MEMKSRVKEGTNWTKNSVRGIIGGKRISQGTNAEIAGVINGLVYAKFAQTGVRVADNGRDIENVIDFQTGDFAILKRDAVNFLPEEGVKGRFYSGDRCFVGYDSATTDVEPSSRQWNKLVRDDINHITGMVELVKVYLNANQYIGVPETFLAPVTGSDKMKNSRTARMNNLNSKTTYETLPIPEENFLEFFNQK